MEKSLHIFNPDHDLALASNSDHYDAPNSARQFAHDFAYLPLWFAKENDVIYVEKPNEEWYAELQQKFPQLAKNNITSNLKTELSIAPWGWNATLLRKLAMSGVMNLPTEKAIADIRELSHRKTSIEAMNELKHLGTKSFPIVSPAVLLQSSEIEYYIEKHPYCIFKAPWSGSGKGICRSLGGLSENLKNRVKNMAERQGSVLAEPLYNVVQNFAMEFFCEQGKTFFFGYSQFVTDANGAYKGNLLATDEQIEKNLTQIVPKQLLDEVKQTLIAFSNNRIAQVYSGYLGVDMFILKTEDGYALHPCVEINVRMTMGLVARLFYDKFVHEGSQGTFSVEFFKNSQMLQNEIQKRQRKIQFAENAWKIVDGCFSITPIVNDTQYCAMVQVYRS